MAKGAKKVDDVWLQKCIETVEAQGGLDSQGELWEKAALAYNAKLPTDMKPIAATLVRNKVQEGEWPIKTISGRQKTANVDLKVLQESIKTVEDAGLPPNRSALFQQVAVLYSKRTGQSCSWATLANLAVKRNLSLKTPKGKRGAGLHQGERKARTPKAEKFASNPDIQESLEKIRATIPSEFRQRFLPIVLRIVEGSRSAVVKLKCLDCSNFNTAEIRHCVVKDCALYPFRPYQGTAAVEEEGDVAELDQEDSEARAIA